MLSIAQKIMAVAQDNPLRVFCHFHQRGATVAITYADLLAHSARYAAVYRTRGITAGDTVMIIADHCPDLFYAFLGAVSIGAIPTILAPKTSKQDAKIYWAGQKALASRIGAALLVAGAFHAEAMQRESVAGSTPIHRIEETPVAAATFDAIDADPDGIALLQHSSGTTGLKKGMQLSHRGIQAQVDSYARTLHLTHDDVIVSWLPLYHDMGLVTGLLMPMLSGVPVVSMDAFEWVAQPWLQLSLIEQHRGTLAWLPNFAFHHLARLTPEEGRWNLSTLRAVIDCSEPCKPESLDLFATRFAAMGLGRPALQACYAMAENVFAVTQTDLGAMVRDVAADRTTFAEAARIAAPDRPDNVLRFLSCGRPIDGVRLAILDDQGQPLGDDEVGEIVIGGASLFTGYYRLPDLTAERLRDGWYHTGDLGFMNQGELFVTGRKDDLLIVNGRNVYAHDIEFSISQIAGIIPGRAIALGIYSAEAGSQAITVLAEVRATPADEAGLKRAIKQRVFSDTQIAVSSVHLLPPGRLIKTTSGKISRAENLRLHQQMRMAGA